MIRIVKKVWNKKMGCEHNDLRVIDSVMPVTDAGW